MIYSVSFCKPLQMNESVCVFGRQGPHDRIHEPIDYGKTLTGTVHITDRVLDADKSAGQPIWSAKRPEGRGAGSVESARP
jgi:hypothetical protein